MDRTNLKFLLAHFSQFTLTLTVTLIAVVLSFFFGHVIYALLGEEVNWITQFSLLLIPVLVAPVVTWNLFGILIALKQSEDDRDTLTQELLNSKDRLQKAQKIAKLGSWHLDIGENQLYWSDEIYRIFEINPQRFGASYEAFLQLIHPEDRETVNQAYLDSLKHQEPYSIDHRLMMPDGRVKYVHEECVSQFDVKGRAICSEGTVHDITEQVLLQQENVRKQEMLYQQAKMAQMGEMLNAIAHQWKQPLAQINSILIDMDGRFESGDFDRRYFDGRLDRIEELTTYMSDTIEEFRTYFHPNKQKTLFTTTEVVEMALALYSPVLSASRIAVVTGELKPYWIEGYKQELAQALLVLLGNACDALDEEKIGKPTIEISTEEKGERIVLSVRNNGMPIPPELLNRIFEPYFSTKEHQGGTGIGLYMAKMIIEKSMGGALQVTSSDQSTTFSITIDKMRVENGRMPTSKKGDQWKS